VHIHRYEKIWLLGGLLMLVVFLATITTAAVVDGFVPPSRVQSIDPAKVSSTPPFDHPGLHEIAKGRYEAYYVGHIFAWEPASMKVPAGARVTFYVTSTDVVHGFSIPQTGVNTMVSPGWVSSVAYTFKKRGTYLVLCNEYCGVAHQAMATSIIVQ
jgi:cytochrome c oxidase subunit 2